MISCVQDCNNSGMNSKVALIWDGLEDIDFRSSGSSAGSLGAALKAAIVFALDQEAVVATAFVPLLMKSQFYHAIQRRSSTNSNTSYFRLNKCIIVVLSVHFFLVNLKCQRTTRTIILQNGME